MGNTVLENTNAETFIEEIRLNLNNNINDNRIIVLVEGYDDMKVYQKFFDTEKVDMQPVNTCHKIIGVMPLVCSDTMLKERVIAIKDADFDHLMSVTYPDSPNMFLTDTHDIETMMMTSQCCINICSEVMLPEKTHLIMDVAEAISHFSYLKYYNIKEIIGKHRPGLNFEGIKVGREIYDGISDVTLEHVYNAVGNRSDNASKGVMPTKEEFSDFMEVNSTEDLMNLTNGHDLINGIIKKIHKMNPMTKSYGSSDIEQITRASYSFSDFSQTELYSAIGSWANGRGIDLWRN